METSKIDFTRINNDTNGNPRYVCHFLNLLSDKEQDEIRANAQPFQSVDDMYNEAISKAKKIGGKKYHNKQYGGGDCVSILQHTRNGKRYFKPFKRLSYEFTKRVYSYLARKINIKL